MSQREYALQLEELRDLNEELQLQIEELKLRLSQYEEVEQSESSTRSDANVSEWAEWPFCWFVNGWSRTAERFHSFHVTLQDESLARRNVRARRCYEKQNNLHDAELTLL
ncbi:MAG TPA: hypothetical protein VM821_02580 [Abditibacteriaceae bacterium]|nr:hypothetical protein [Abditibacteriaceae bacterium]